MHPDTITLPILHDLFPQMSRFSFRFLVSATPAARNHLHEEFFMATPPL